MALVPCKECGKQVSTKARACPNCGAPRGCRQRGAAVGAAVAMVTGITVAMTSHSASRNVGSGDPTIAIVLGVLVVALLVVMVVLRLRG